MKNKAKIVGHLKIIETRMDDPDDEGTVVFDDDNVVTNDGLATFVQRVTTENGGSFISNIVLGDDVGNGNVFDPEDAVSSYDATDQSEVYEIPPEDIVFSYPQQNAFVMTTTLDGTYIMDTFFPEETDLQYTSATTRFDNADVFSYKRFPVRSISRLISVQVVWTFTFNEV